MLTYALVALLPALTPEFQAHWFDGNAEVAGYALRQPRYGVLREGTAVMIFVTETFSEEARVKADSGRRPDSDVFTVMKLNLVKDFQTGIYDYNLMTSVFVGLEPHGGRPLGLPAKVTFSAQEWCGNTFEELLFGPGEARRRSFSYFDGEGDRDVRISLPAGAVTQDQLPLLVRGIPESLPLGRSVRPMLRGSQQATLQHRDYAVVEAVFQVGEETRALRVPAGSFEAKTITVQVDGMRWVYDVEVAFPHRLIRWRGPDGEQGQLTGAARLPYWQLSGPGGEAALDRLGLR